MKYIITRKFAFNNKKFEVISNSKTVCTVKASHSKEYKGQFNIKLSNLPSKYVGENCCIVELDPNKPQKYLIYSINNQSDEKTLFGQLFYQFCNYDTYLYTIIIGQKLYNVRSCDLKDRRLAIIDLIQSNTKLNYPQTLFQVIESFSKSTKIYHVNIHDDEWSFGYLAITILLHLHESQRNNH